MKKFSDFASDVEAAIRNLSLNNRYPQSLYSPIEYALTAGGKRLRPAMLLMSAHAFGGEPAAQKAMNAALAVEIFHNFTLLHDDVMDNSDLRRGRPTVHAKWDENTAILSGDTMLTMASSLLTDVETDALKTILSIFNNMAIEVYEGQRLDMDFENEPDVDPDDYLEMIRLKTGALLGASAAIGGLIGGASREDVDKLLEFGNMLGIAFQIQDDWLDTFGDSITFGKPIGGDIRNGKKTFLLVNALAGNPEDAAVVRSAMALEGDLRVKTVTRLFEKMGLSQSSRKAVASYSAKAVNALKATSMPDESRKAFIQVVDKLTGRRK